MLAANELLDLYRQEKAAMDDYANPFPSFADWKVAYVEEYKSNHADRVTVTVDEADQMMDTLLAETETDFEQTETTTETLKETTMNLNTETTATVVADQTASTEQTPAAPVAEAPKAAKKTSVKKPSAKVAKKTSTAVAKPSKKAAADGKSKADQARSIIRKLWRSGTDFPRAKVVAALMSEAGLSKNGASTYAQKHKTEIAADRKAAAKAKA